MTELKEDLLELLKCDFCNGYLSYPPIFITNENKNVCGRCHLTGDEKTVYLMRNSVYENLAKIALFPCPWKDCDKKLSISDMKIHEDSEHQFSCPKLPAGSCNWKGSSKTILNHFENEHNELIIKLPYTERPELGINEKIMITLNFGFLFIVHIKCDITQGKMWHLVKLLDDEKLCSLFQFSLVLKSEEGQLVKKRQVQSKNVYLCDENENAIETNLNSVLIALGGLYKNLDIKLSVSMLPIRCTDCNCVLNLYPIYSNNDKFYCSKCNKSELPNTTCCTKCKTFMFPFKITSDINLLCSSCDAEQVKKSSLKSKNNTTASTSMTQCEHTSKGCTFSNKNQNVVVKHQTWFCNFANPNCNWGCSKKTKLTDTNLFQHYKEKHSENNSSLIMNPLPSDSLNVSVIFTSEKDIWHKASIVISPKLEFIYRYRVNDKNCNLLLISNIPVKQTEKYLCKVGFLNYKTKPYVMLERNINLEDWVPLNRWDYSLNQQGNFISCFNSNEFYMVLKITRCTHNNAQVNTNTSGPKLYCKYRGQGCDYFHYNKKNIYKHERLLCTYSITNCVWTCKKKIKGISLFEHYLTYCKKYVKLEKQPDFLLEGILDEWNVCKVSISEYVFLCFYRVCISLLDIFILSNIPAESVNDFNWNVGIKHVDTNFYYENNIKIENWDSNEFWLADHKEKYKLNFKDFIDNKKYELKFTLSSKCKNCI